MDNTITGNSSTFYCGSDIQIKYKKYKKPNYNKHFRKEITNQ